MAPAATDVFTRTCRAPTTFAAAIERSASTVAALISIASPPAFPAAVQRQKAGTLWRRASSTAGPRLSTKSQCAIVAPSDLAFGLSRMYQTLSEQAEFEIEVFRDFVAARSWVVREGQSAD